MNVASLSPAEIEHQNVYYSGQAAQPPPPPPSPPPWSTRRQHNCVEIARAYLAVAAAAEACCCFCGNEKTPPPNEARAIRREGRRAKPDRATDRKKRGISFRPRHVLRSTWYIYLLAAWMADLGAYEQYPPCSNERIELILIPSISLDTSIRTILFSR